MENIICKILGHKLHTRYDIKQNKAHWCWSCTYCERCHTVLDTSQKNHEFVDVYPDNPCEYVTQCKNCGYQLGQHTSHEFDHDHPVLDGCTKHFICTKCGAKSKPQINHKFSGPKIMEGCVAYKLCERCGQRSSGTPSHDYGEPQHTGCVVFRLCSRCGDQKILEVHHEFEFTGQHSNENTVAHYTTTSITYTCKKCGEKKFESNEYYTDW